MLSEIKVSNNSGHAVIDIEGVIGVPEQAQFENPENRVATYAKFAEAVKRIAAIDAGKILVNIRSTGGNVHDALLIYDALKALPAHITTRCSGYTASAATIIAQAASAGSREISSNALYLIHCSESAAEGNSRSFDAARELLDKTDSRLADIYAENGGRESSFYIGLMCENNGRGRWLTAREAVDAGLADRISTGKGVANSAEPSAADTLLAMLGLPPLPHGETETGKPGITEMLIALRRIFAGGKNEARKKGKQAEVKAKPAHRTRKDGGSRNNEQPSDMAGGDHVFNEIWRRTQSEAKPTSTKQIEDPAISEGCYDANAKAYREDAVNIRDR